EGMAIGLGLAIGAVGAVGIAQMLASVLFASDGMDVTLIVGAGAGLAAGASLAPYLPARRAARLRPLPPLLPQPPRQRSGTITSQPVASSCRSSEPALWVRGAAVESRGSRQAL